VCVCVCVFVCVCVCVYIYIYTVYIYIEDSETPRRKETGKNIHGPGSSQAAPTCPSADGS
jgi:hypothetical protein